MDDRNDNSQPQQPLMEPFRPTTSLEPQSAPVPPPLFSGPPIEPPKRRRKGIIIASVIVAVLVLLGGGGVAAYNLWYQNPEKVVTDGIINALKAKSVTYTGNVTVDGNMKMKIELSGANAGAASDIEGKATFNIMGGDYKVGIGARYVSNGDLYFRIKDIDPIIDALRTSVPPESMATFDALVAKVNNQWIKVSAEDLAGFSEDVAKVQQCTRDAVVAYQNDQAALGELTRVYEKNKFLVVDQKLGDKNGSLGYVLKLNEAASKGFLVGLKDTKIYKTLNECDASIAIDEKTLAESFVSEEKIEKRVELWVDRWTHQITEFNTTAKVKNTDNVASLVFHPTFNKDVKINAPENATSLSQLQKDIEALFYGLGDSELSAEEAAFLESEYPGIMQ